MLKITPKPTSNALLLGIKPRQIAFRAWHIPTATMWKVGMFSDHHVFRAWDESLSDEENYKVVDVHMLRKDCVLMQQTEFTDWFGQPLYEGDILRCDMVQTPEDIVDGEEEYSYYQCIAFHNGAFIFIHAGQDISENPRLWAWSESLLFERSAPKLHYTLAGNVFETPELATRDECIPLHPDHIRG